MELRKKSESKSNQDLSIEDETRNEGNYLSLSSKNLTTSLPALQRRFANDPHMMKELQRYQKIMFLTLLPSISSQQRLSINSHSSNNHESHQQFQHHTEEQTSTVAAEATSTAMESNSRKSAIKEIKDSMIEIKSSIQNMKNSFSNQEKETTRVVSGWGNRATACHSTFGVDQSSIASLTSNANNVRVPQSSAVRVRRKSRTDGEAISSLLNKSMNIEDFSQHAAVEHNNSNLDFTTLTALYLESRQRIFGEEWMKRRDKEHLLSSRDAGEIGAIGIFKPRRLLPLNSESLPAAPSDLPRAKALPERRRHSLVPSAAPAGLHLSARFNHSFNLDDPTLIKSRTGSHKSRLRRLNSMDEFSLLATDGESNVEIHGHRPSSAPHLPKKDINEVDAFSLPQETPARANTPTGASSSAHVIRPQLMGGSLVTFSPDQSLSISKKKNLQEPERLKENTIDETFNYVTSEINRPFRKSLPTKLSPNIQNEESDPLHRHQLASLPKPVGRLPKKGSRFKLSPLENTDKKHSVP